MRNALRRFDTVGLPSPRVDSSVHRLEPGGRLAPSILHLNSYRLVLCVVSLSSPSSIPALAKLTESLLDEHGRKMTVYAITSMAINGATDQVGRAVVFKGLKALQTACQPE